MHMQPSVPHMSTVHTSIVQKTSHCPKSTRRVPVRGGATGCRSILPLVGHQHSCAGQRVPGLGEEGGLQQTAHLVPVGEGLCGGCGQPHSHPAERQEQGEDDCVFLLVVTVKAAQGRLTRIP